MLKRENVEALRSGGNAHILEKTAAYFEGPLERNEFVNCAAKLGSIPVPSGMIWGAYGYGSSPRRRYLSLSQLSGVKIRWMAPCVPWFLYPLSWVAACHGGFIEIAEPVRLEKCLDELSSLAMVEAYLVSRETVPTIDAYVRNNRWKSFIGEVAGVEARYFCVGADGDSRESETGLLAWCSYGPACGDSLVQAMGPFAS